MIADLPLRYLLLLSSLTLSVYSSISFVMNPGCDKLECQTPGNPAIFYANQFINDDTIHILYSSFDELTISIIQTKKGFGPSINYTALFAKNYSGSIVFDDTTPSNSFSVILRRLIQFNDQNDTGKFDENKQFMQSYWLNGLKANITDRKNNITQPALHLPLTDIDGLLTIDINYPGESTRDSNYPKLCSTPKSYFLNLAIQANNYTLSRTRFAFEFYIIQFGLEGTQQLSSTFIDDQYTPGIFNVWQLKSLSPIYASSMLWKPVVYQSLERSIEKTTLMAVYLLKNNISLDSNIDQGIFNALYRKPYVSGFNVSLGRAKDGFFAKSNYTFIQFTAGLDILEPDSIKKYVTLALIVTLALPSLVILIATIFILKRQCTTQDSNGYDEIDD